MATHKTVTQTSDYGYPFTKVFFIILFIIAPFSFLQSQIAKLDAYFSTKSERGDFNGVILVAEKNKILYQKAFGFADFESKQPNTIHTRFPVGSITKLLTATAVLQLVDKGLLNLDQPVKSYLQEFPYPEITLTHLLSHTSGLPSWDVVFKKIIKEHPNTVFSNKDILKEYSEQNINLVFRPGSAHEYNNANSVFAALLIEKITGLSYEDYMKQHIFIPASMKNTFIPTTPFFNYLPTERKNVAKLYISHMYTPLKENTETIQSNKEYWKRFNFKGFGEVISTAEDLFQFNTALTTGKILNSSVLKAAQEAIQLNNGTVLPRGIGWQVETDDILGKIVGHGGGLTGLLTSFVYQIDTQRVAIILDNTQQNAEDLSIDALMILAGQPLAPPGKDLARIYGRILLEKGAASARNELYTLKKNITDYSLSEQQFNKLGYDFLRSGKLPQALETFRINTELFPQSFNTFDSYGEALLKNKQKEKALIMYQKSVELNPDSENGKKIIQELMKQ
ncbi:hypothetical protein C1631_021665 [Chryseobacterium phosphatilyticum]|uniref:Beta-lactamase-related domain-containing protein n=1 Tax=Chryseobacterium phosphatilyticum TaxID=475075 RepID=A0A316WQY9_9FLAO|nr:serine hydrolase domain-containing protein [Chryseobacterium phosphatilyticum]PWN63589.1 hypothetical protein C1631_021665 [Chryseobacterium phosphatilyticum]